MNRAIAVCREENRSALLVSTATADTGALRFYQRLGFRFLRVERDVFTPQAGYPPTEIDGVPLRDQIWLSLALDDSPMRPDATQLRVADIPSASTSSYGSTATGWGSSESAASRTTTATTACASQFRAPVPTSNSPRAGATAPEPHPESLLVLYLGSEQSVRTVSARLGSDPVAPANPYWAQHATTFADPDGFHVVLVPDRWQPSDSDHNGEPTPPCLKRQPSRGPWSARLGAHGSSRAPADIPWPQ